MRTRATVLATDAAIEEVADRELIRSKSAVAAVIAGFFAAAGFYDDVLLGPTTLLVAGVGSGGRVFDGRLCQPGLGARRPRGWLPGDTVPVAARVALPTTVPALTAALAYDRAATLTALAKVGAAAAKDVHAEGRARLLGRIAAVGGAALGEATFMRPLLHLASPSEGGLLTPADFTAASELTVLARERPVEDGLVLEPPWADAEPAEATGTPHGLCAIDARGVFAAIAYARIGGAGIGVDGLELRAALAATPVERGRPRVRPGERIAWRAPLAVGCDTAGVPREVSVGIAEKGARGSTIRIARNAARWLTATK